MKEALCHQLKTADSKLAYYKPEVRLLSNLTQTEASKKMPGVEDGMGMDGMGQS